LNLIIGENLELSGGQKQLLEIARVILQQKPILILDEGTNQLDAEKEQLVLDLLQQAKKQAIVIFITHRMTTTKKCDQILVLENGQITATGTPEQLLEAKQKNLFKTFWETQVQK
jgi:ABC-type multidrug transport system fused ATPase/permease subunit